MDNRRIKCCKYIEKNKRTLGLNNKKKTMKTKLNKQKNCQINELNLRLGCKECPERTEKSNKPQSSKIQSEADQLIPRIQPSFSDREKYFNSRHVFCFLEDLKKQKGTIHTTKAKPVSKLCESKFKDVNTFFLFISTVEKISDTF